MTQNRDGRPSSDSPSGREIHIVDTSFHHSRAASRRRTEDGMTRHESLEVLAQPADSSALVLVDGAVFASLSTRIAG